MRLRGLLHNQTKLLIVGGAVIATYSLYDILRHPLPDFRSFYLLPSAWSCLESGLSDGCKNETETLPDQCGLSRMPMR